MAVQELRGGFRRPSAEAGEGDVPQDAHLPDGGLREEEGEEIREEEEEKEVRRRWEMKEEEVRDETGDEGGDGR